SVGLIEIKPVMQSGDKIDRIMPLYQQYVLTAVNTLHSEKVIKEAMKSPERRKYRPAPPETYIDAWNKNLLVKLIPNSCDITVTYTDDHKDGKVVAPVAVASLIR